MKKVSLVLAIMALSVTGSYAIAQNSVEPTVETNLVMQDKVEIPLSELPAAISDALAANYADYEAVKAFKSSADGNDIYEVEMKNEDSTVTIAFDAEGNVVEK